MVVRAEALWTYGQRILVVRPKDFSLWKALFAPSSPYLRALKIAYLQTSGGTVDYFRFLVGFQKSECKRLLIIHVILLSSLSGPVVGCSFPILDSTELDKVDRAFMIPAYLEFIELTILLHLMSTENFPFWNNWKWWIITGQTSCSTGKKWRFLRPATGQQFRYFTTYCNVWRLKLMPRPYCRNGKTRVCGCLLRKTVWFESRPNEEIYHYR